MTSVMHQCELLAQNSTYLYYINFDNILLQIWIFGSCYDMKQVLFISVVLEMRVAVSYMTPRFEKLCSVQEAHIAN